MFMYGCKVEISDWIDGTHDLLYITHYQPGAPMSNPDAQHGYLVPKSQRRTLDRFLDSVVRALTAMPYFWTPYVPGKLLVIDLSAMEMPAF